MSIIINELVNVFQFDGEMLNYKAYGNGHINDTFYVECSNDEYILQRINTDIFTKPYELMENIEMVTQFLKEKITENGGNPDRETLNIVLTKDAKNIYKDSAGHFWRAYEYIDQSYSYDLVEDPEDFYESGVAFGTFQYRLADFPIEQLNFTIENFHHTPKRYQTFIEAVEKDVAGRADNVQEEIEAIKEQAEFVNVLWDLHADGKLPLRVTHNDTKLNNVLFDKVSKEGICVVDLDTVMPGFSLDDFGDAIRFGASTALEDEKDLEKVKFDIDLFDIYIKGFLKGANGSLSELEIDLFPEGAKMMTLESAIRFLTDYLEGDTYFKTAYEEHNLVRARTQIKLVQEMDNQWDAMQEVVQKNKEAQLESVNAK